MVVASQGFYFFVLTRLPKMIKEGFQPAFSALTFPTVITATSLKMAQGLLQLPFLTALVWLETLLCLLILVAVLGGYVAYLRAVSYTHLDVYKRQALERSLGLLDRKNSRIHRSTLDREMGRMDERTSWIKDVYKRQDVS